MSEQNTIDNSEERVIPQTSEATPEVEVDEGATPNTATTPEVEIKDGKMYVDGVRVYAREETNTIASRAKQEAVSNVLQELEIDSLDSVKEVIKTLREGDDGEPLNVQQLKDTVKKKEQTVEELQSQLTQLQTQMVMNSHLTELYNNMPGGWNADQKQAVVDLMNARQMLVVEGDTFAIRNGEDYLSQDGQKPDYKGAVELIGKTLGLPMAKKGVDLTNMDKVPSEEKASKGIDDSRLKNDAKYRSAYTSIRHYQPSLSRSQITDEMIVKKMEEMTQSYNPNGVLAGNTNLRRY